jgi:hypothetical protein
MASGASNHNPTLSSAPAPAASAPMNLSSMDLAQLQANGIQAIPGLDPTQLMNLLRHLPNVFTKVRPFADLIPISSAPLRSLAFGPFLSFATPSFIS